MRSALFPVRTACLLAALAAAGLLGFAYYLEFARGLEACPLCMLQRLAFAVFGLLALGAALHGPGRTGLRLYALGGLTASAAGGGIAARHLYLQQLSAEARPACGPGFDYLLDTFPLAEALGHMLQGSGECGAVGWQWLGLSIPAWALLWFALFGVASLFVLWRPGRVSDRLPG